MLISNIGLCQTIFKCFAKFYFCNNYNKFLQKRFPTLLIKRAYLIYNRYIRITYILYFKLLKQSRVLHNQLCKKEPITKLSLTAHTHTTLQIRIIVIKTILSQKCIKQEACAGAGRDSCREVEQAHCNVISDAFCVTILLFQPL